MKIQKEIIITHIVNPHHFYFKYVSDIGCEQDFEFEIQNYGNTLYQKNEHRNGYIPIENEMVLIYNVIYNKWLRGKVMTVDAVDVKVWCIDIGKFEKSPHRFTLPLKPEFHTKRKTLCLGGLSLLPVEKNFNVETAFIEVQKSKQWDAQTMEIFHTMIKTSKRISFTETTVLSNHVFGNIVVESIHDKTFVVNDKFVGMNTAITSTTFDEDIIPFVNSSQLLQDLYKSSKENEVISEQSSKVIKQQQISKTISEHSGEMTASSKVSTWINEQPLLSSQDFDESIAILSKSSMSDTLESSISQKNMKMRIQKKSINQPNHDDGNYQCHLRKCSELQPNVKCRQPLKSSMDWITSFEKNAHTPYEDQFCGVVSQIESKVGRNSQKKNVHSSIEDLNESCASLPSPSSGSTRVSSVSSNTARMTNRTKMLQARIAARKFNKTNVSDIVTAMETVTTNRMNAIPAGFQLNALHTFGSKSKPLKPLKVTCLQSK